MVGFLAALAAFFFGALALWALLAVGFGVLESFYGHWFIWLVAFWSAFIAYRVGRTRRR